MSNMNGELPSPFLTGFEPVGEGWMVALTEVPNPFRPDAASPGVVLPLMYRIDLSETGVRGQQPQEMGDQQLPQAQEGETSI